MFSHTVLSTSQVVRFLMILLSYHSSLFHLHLRENLITSRQKSHQLVAFAIFVHNPASPPCGQGWSILVFFQQAIDFQAQLEMFFVVDLGTISDLLCTFLAVSIDIALAMFTLVDIDTTSNLLCTFSAVSINIVKVQERRLVVDLFPVSFLALP